MAGRRVAAPGSDRFVRGAFANLLGSWLGSRIASIRDQLVFLFDGGDGCRRRMPPRNARRLQPDFAEQILLQDLDGLHFTISSTRQKQADHGAAAALLLEHLQDEQRLVFSAFSNSVRT